MPPEKGLRTVSVLMSVLWDMRLSNYLAIDEFTNEEGEEYGASNFGGFGDYFRRKKIKLQNLDAEIRSSAPDKPQIFKGVIAHVNGYTQPSLNDLHRMIVSHGGGFLQYLDGKTAATHIIASALTPKKREEFRRYRIVKPSWVVESIQADRLLPWESFRLVNEGISQKVLNFDPDGKITSRVNPQTSSYRSQTDSSWYSSQIKKDNIREDSPTNNATSSRLSPKVASPLPGATKQNAVRESTPTRNETRIHVVPDDILDEQGSPRRRSVSQPKPTVVKEQPKPAENADILENSNNETVPDDKNVLIRSDPRKMTSAANPDFIKQYYQESRLHHLSTWKAELKTQLQKLTQENGSPQPTTKRLPPGVRRYILHVDFDSFFAAVSLKKYPELVDKPIAIAHGTGPGSEIASCNYPARTFGVKNGMWMKGALQLCPELKVLPYDFAAYEDASRKFYESILSIGGLVQSVSIDEALIDATRQCISAGGSDGKAMSEGSIWREQEMADNIAQGLRDSVKQKTGCNVSVGIGGNILQAKLALKKAKPAGQFQLKPEELLEFIGELTARDLPGVAHSLNAKLEELGVKFVKDIRQLTKERLVSHLGPKTGARLWDYSRGLDKTEVGEQVVRKSVSAEINWGIRFINQTQAEEFVQGLCDELHRRLVDNVVKGKQLTMKIMRRSVDAPVEPPKHLGHGKCDTFNKSIILGVSTNNSEVIGKEAISMLRSFNFPPSDLRGLGVQMTKLEPMKAGVKGAPESSSQRRLQFRPSSPVQTGTASLDPDEIVTPKKGDVSAQYIPESIKSGLSLNDASQKPLNVTGTQFILPSQVSPTVLAELPQDIRSQFSSKSRPSIGERLKAAATTSQRPGPGTASTALPPQSQLDHETLNALPGDVRDEVLSYYNQTADIPNEASRPVPVKQNSAAPKYSKRITTPTKSRTGRGRGRPSLSAKPNASSTLTQSNFIFSRPTSSTSATGDETGLSIPNDPADTADEILSEFLDALPDDIRREVLEEHKRTRLQKHGGLNLPTAGQKTLKPGSPKPQPPDQKLLSFPPRPAKPTFTSKKLSSLPELREALSEWHSSFETEGPYEEDVEALAKYLQRVIVEEKDIAKAVDLARWLAWLIGDNPNSAAEQDSPRRADEDSPQDKEDQPSVSWNTALAKVRDDINGAIKERGLPAVEFN